MKKTFWLVLFTLPWVLTTCDIADNEVGPNDSFLKIYDQNEFSSEFSPLDVQQTSDGGYVVLSATRLEDSNFSGIYILKTNSRGEFERETLMASNENVHPISQILKIQDSLYFVGMNPTSLQAQLYQIRATGAVTPGVGLGGLTYPLHAGISQDSSEIILQSYNNNDKNTVLSTVSVDGSVTNSQTFNIGAGPEVEAPIIQHFNRTGRQLPFLAGQTIGGLYYFNGFNNFTMSLVFTNLGGGTSGIAQGQQDDGGLSSILDLGGGNFAVSIFDFGDNFIVPLTTINTTGTSSLVDLQGNSFPELVDDAPITVKSIAVGAENLSVFGSHTQSGQIILMGFDQTTGELRGTEYLGFSNPFELSSFNQTTDGGIIVAGTTYVAGRFARICLIKLSREELNGLR